MFHFHFLFVYFPIVCFPYLMLFIFYFILPLLFPFLVLQFSPFDYTCNFPKCRYICFHLQKKQIPYLQQKYLPKYVHKLLMFRSISVINKGSEGPYLVNIFEVPKTSHNVLQSIREPKLPEDETECVVEQLAQTAGMKQQCVCQHQL